VAKKSATDGWLAEIDHGLRSGAVPGRAESEKAYLKSALEHWGTPVPAIRATVKAFVRAHAELDREATLSLARALWKEPLHERRTAAIELLAAKRKLLLVEDAAALLEPMLREAKTWAYVDALSTEVVAHVLGRFPALVKTLDRWSRDPDFWLRRTAMLALLPELRKGGGDFDRFTGYADHMLEEKEFFIRKAIGWILRETGKKTPQRVTAWLRPRAGRAAGLTVREAVKYLPEKDRAAILLLAKKGKP
jgi:3-methyladenine DNA glycosylase AlkD